MIMENKRQFIFSSEKTFDILNVVFMVFLGLITIYPFWYCLMLSLSDGADAARAPIFFLPRVFSLENYTFIFTNPRTLNAAAVSVARTVTGVLLHLVLTGIVSYGLSKKDIMGRKIYLAIFTVTMYFSGGLIPTYLLINNLGLMDNFFVYVIPTMFSFYNCILMMSYYSSIPAEVEEAAAIDGADPFRTFLLIIVPASLPMFATIALFVGVAQWNAWFDSLIYTTSPELMTLQAIVQKMISQAEAIKELNEQLAASGAVDGFQTVSPITVRVSTMIFTILPISLIYPFLQRYFIKGIMLGAVKG